MRPILLVDDDANDVLLLQRALHKAGVERPLVVLGDGEQAVAYLAGDAERPELILLDLNMPRCSGFEVLEWLRAQPGLRRLVVVVLTASADPGDIARAYDLGANSYLVKPSSFRALVDVVHRIGVYWLDLNRHPEGGVAVDAHPADR